MRAQKRPVGPVLCDDCWDRAKELDERRAELAQRPAGALIVGEQPRICLHCGEPFLAVHAGVKYCSTAHRAAAWRAAHRTAAA